MNKLPPSRRAQILHLLYEGSSMRAVTAIVGCSINTATNLLEDVGAACHSYQNGKLRNLPCKRVQPDEIWAFCFSKAKNAHPEKHGQCHRSAACIRAPSPSKRSPSHSPFHPAFRLCAVLRLCAARLRIPHYAQMRRNPRKTGNGRNRFNLLQDSSCPGADPFKWRISADQPGTECTIDVIPAYAKCVPWML